MNTTQWVFATATVFAVNELILMPAMRVCTHLASMLNTIG